MDYHSSALNPHALVPICYRISTPTNLPLNSTCYLLGTVHTSDLDPHLAARLEYFIGHFVRSLNPSEIFFEVNFMSPRLQKYWLQTDFWELSRYKIISTENVLYSAARDKGFPVEGLTSGFTHYCCAPIFASISVGRYSFSLPSYRKALVRYPSLTISLRGLIALLSIFFSIHLIASFEKQMMRTFHMGLPTLMCGHFFVMGLGWLGNKLLSLSKKPAKTPYVLYSTQGQKDFFHTYAQSFLAEPWRLRGNIKGEVHYCNSAREALWFEKIQNTLTHSQQKLSWFFRILNILEDWLCSQIEPLFAPKKEPHGFAQPDMPSYRIFQDTLKELSLSQKLPSFSSEPSPLIAVGLAHIEPLLWRFQRTQATIESVNLLTGKIEPFILHKTAAQEHKAPQNFGPNAV